MTSEDDTRARLRVGGWLPPYRAFPPGADALTAPVVYRSQSPVNVDTPVAMSRPAKGDRRRSTVVFCTAVAGLLLIGLAVTGFGSEPPPQPVGGEVRLPVAPALPVGPAEPAASAASASHPAPARPTADRGTRRPVRAAAPAGNRKPSRTSSSPVAARPTREPVPALRAGTAISLEVADAPGLRVRHRDFRGRVDRIGPDIPALARADARFIVRAGPAGRGCFSFQAANHPGRFLRHRDFGIRLARADRTRLFTEDATFSPGSGGRSDVVALRSWNHPDRFVTLRRAELRLTPATTTTATRFAVRPPL